jgi:hypothetical protein
MMPKTQWMSPSFVIAALVVPALLCGCGSGGNSTVADGVQTGPLRITPGSSAQFRQHGTDNSLEEYGDETGRAELAQAAANVHAYLVARAGRDWHRACALGSSKLHRILEGVFASTEQSIHRSCAAMIAIVARGGGATGETAYKATRIDARSFRTDGNYGYLFFYSGGGGRQQELFREGGVWKVKALLPSSLH